MSNRRIQFSIRNFFLLSGISLFISSCQFNDKKDDKLAETESVDSPISEKMEDSYRPIKIVTNSMEFITKDEYPAGWNTFKYENNSNETHFVLFEKYPEGKGVEDGEKEIAPVYQEAMDLINAGKVEEGFATFAKLPDWYKEVQFPGGIGLISPKSEAESTFKLEPGTYVIECYVKMPNGQFHVNNGMVKEIKVTEKEHAEPERNADHSISISAGEGIVFEENVSPGTKTFRVEFGEQKLHENNLMHDVHLVWVDKGADLNKLNAWMNVATPEGLQTPAPGGFKFLGGIQEMPAGESGFFTADLKPGRYALISEIPDPQSKGLLKTFSVK